jgi:hypothetical protein
MRRCGCAAGAGSGGAAAIAGDASGISPSDVVSEVAPFAGGGALAGAEAARGGAFATGAHAARATNDASDVRDASDPKRRFIAALYRVAPAARRGRARIARIANAK